MSIFTTRKSPDKECFIENQYVNWSDGGGYTHYVIDYDVGGYSQGYTHRMDD